MWLWYSALASLVFILALAVSSTIRTWVHRRIVWYAPSSVRNAYLLASFAWGVAKGMAFPSPGRGHGNIDDDGEEEAPPPLPPTPPMVVEKTASAAASKESPLRKQEHRRRRRRRRETFRVDLPCEN